MTDTEAWSLYESPRAIAFFNKDTALQAPEAAILEQLRGWLADAAMLDIGVGTGRTTAHFAPLVREYTGVDYAPAMIDAARERFGDAYPLQVADVRALPFDDGAFDFVLFSYNGIDHLETDDRHRALAEIRRVLRPGGRFVFSTHNLSAIPSILALRWSLTHMRRALHLRRINLPVREIMRRDDYMLEERVFYEKLLHTYYIRPSAQLRQLAEAGFRDVEAYRLDGSRIASLEMIDEATDRWLYFVCA